MAAYLSGREAAEAIRRLAEVLEDYEVSPFYKPESGPLDPDLQIGAALMVSYLRDLFTGSEKESFSRDEILVLLDTIKKDTDLFTMDLVELFDQEGAD